jgi:hypothetical protein
MQRVEFVAVPQGQVRACRQPATPARRVIADQGDTLHALPVQLLEQLRHGQGTVDGLPAGHRHRVVVENLVGDVDTGGDRRAYGQYPRVEVGAVAEVLEYVRRVVNGAWPIQVTPSPPICVKVSVGRSAIQVAM